MWILWLWCTNSDEICEVLTQLLLLFPDKLREGGNPGPEKTVSAFGYSSLSLNRKQEWVVGHFVCLNSSQFSWEDLDQPLFFSAVLSLCISLVFHAVVGRWCFGELRTRPSGDHCSSCLLRTSRPVVPISPAWPWRRWVCGLVERYVCASDQCVWTQSDALKVKVRSYLEDISLFFFFIWHAI